jgi:hypothetical protein
MVGKTEMAIALANEMELPMIAPVKKIGKMIQTRSMKEYGTKPEVFTSHSSMEKWMGIRKPFIIDEIDMCKEVPKPPKEIKYAFTSNFDMIPPNAVLYQSRQSKEMMHELLINTAYAVDGGFLVLPGDEYYIHVLKLYADKVRKFKKELGDPYGRR